MLDVEGAEAVVHIQIKFFKNTIPDKFYISMFILGVETLHWLKANVRFVLQ